MSDSRTCTGCGRPRHDHDPGATCPNCRPDPFATRTTLDPDAVGPAVAPPGDLVKYFGDYELLGEIARGGMGVVYRAGQISLNRPVALGRGKTLTTAADVYSLGAILYELLTGRVPFKGASVPETLLLVQQREPDHPRTLNPHANRDLSTIALKCLEKDPNRRYGSAEALVDELERWLRGEPIQARPSTSGERLAKWARRNPAVTAMGMLVFVIAVAGVTGVVWQWRAAVLANSQLQVKEGDIQKSNLNLQESLAVARQRRDEARLSS